jgi:Peptidase C13 family
MAMKRLPFLALLATLLISACTATVPSDTPALLPIEAHTVSGDRAVLVAGDGQLPVFDNAVNAMANRLSGVAIQQLSGTPEVIARDNLPSASLGHVLDAIAGMQPSPGYGCFVFATSHGIRGRGLELAASEQTLDPVALDRALVRGCGNAPTVVIVSGCFTGGFARAPMTRPNRIILTASRTDRTSFGCGAGRTYTVFDECLLSAMDGNGTWKDAYAVIRRCVGREELRGDFLPSEPQAYFGAQVAGMALPPRS